MVNVITTSSDHELHLLTCTDRPGAKLVRIAPHAPEGADVFGQPDEEADQHETQQQGHAAVAVERAEHHGGARVQAQRAGGQIPAVVADVVVGEEVGVDQQRDQHRHPVRRMVADAQVEQAPGLDDVAADGRVHEAGKQRHAEHLGVGEVGIAPRLDGARHLEHLQREADHVKQADGFQLVPGFQPAPHHRALDRQRHQQQHVVARQAEQAGARHQEARRQRTARRTGTTSPP